MFDGDSHIQRYVQANLTTGHSGGRTLWNSLFEVIFNDSHGELSNAERSVAEHICTNTATELRKLPPALPEAIRVESASRGPVIPQLGHGARATTAHSLSFAADPISPRAAPNY